MTTPTNNLIEEASNQIWNAGSKLTHNQLDDILSTLLTKHEDAVLEREALALEGMKKTIDYTDTKVTALDRNKYYRLKGYEQGNNKALQQAADHLRANQSDHE